MFSVVLQFASFKFYLSLLIIKFEDFVMLICYLEYKNWVMWIYIVSASMILLSYYSSFDHV